MKLVFALLACASAVVARPNHIPGHVDPPQLADPAAAAPEPPTKDIQLPKTEALPPPKDIQLPKTEALSPSASRRIRDLSHSYQTPEGIVRSEAVDPVQNRIVGRVSWPAPDGRTYSVSYLGDGTGYHAEGAHIPR